MLSNPSPYFTQGFMPQFPGLSGMGVPQTGAVNFGQPGADGLAGQFGQLGQLGPIGQLGADPRYAAFANPYSQGHPHLNAGSYSGSQHPAQPIVQLLAQLAQQIQVQSAVTQQIGNAIQQLAQHVAVQALHSQQGAGFGAGQQFGLSGQFAGGLGAQPFGQNPFAGAGPGGYGGFNRSQTIQ
jgi:hypothetical protein